MKRLLIGIVGAALIVALCPLRAGHAADVQIVPLVCIVNYDSIANTLTAQYGVDNQSAVPVTIPIAPVQNFFIPAPGARGQPTTFQPDLHPDLFTVTFSLNDTSELLWSLNGIIVRAVPDTPRCGNANPPANQTPPSVIGTPQIGQTLTADEGEWLSDCTDSFTNTWQTSRNNGPWTPVGTGTTYTPTASDLGTMLRVEVVASNCNGTASALDSAAVGPITAAPPAIGAPLLPLVDCVTDNAAANTLTVQWAYYSAYAQTQTVALGSDNAVSPTPAGGTPLTSFDPGLHHNAWTATLNLAQSQQLSWTLNGTTASASVANPACGESSPPGNQTQPGAIGTPAIGQTLTADNGVWLANCSLSFTDSWQRQVNGGAWATVGTGITYLLTAADAGALLRVEVLASDCHGQASAVDSAAVGPIAPPAQLPVNTAAPSIKVTNGGFQPGRTFTAVSTNGGTWTGAPTVSYQWQRCTDTACTDIAGATKAKYTVAAADAGDLLRVVVTATNSAGTATAVSAEADPSASGDQGGR